MFEALIETIQQAARPSLMTINGKPYVSGELRLLPEPRVTTLEVSTLTGLVSFFETKGEHQDDELFVHVQSPQSVFLCGKITGADKVRTVYCHATAITASGMRFGHHLTAEDFVVALQSYFVKTPTVEKILQVAGNLSDEYARQTADDGVTQRVTVRRGLAKTDETTVPNPVALAPFRTFPEVDQPESNYILRIRPQQGDTPLLALFEVTDHKWQLTAMKNIQDFLVPKMKDVTIIA